MAIEHQEGKHAMRKMLLGLIAIGLVSTATAQAQAVDAGNLYRQFHEAINRGDADAALSFLAEDVTWRRAPSCLPLCKGKDLIRDEVLRQIKDHNKTGPFTIEVRDESAVVRFEHRSDFTRARGFERRIQLDTVTARNGKIATIVSALDLSDPDTAAFAKATARP